VRRRRSRTSSRPSGKTQARARTAARPAAGAAAKRRAGGAIGRGAPSTNAQPVGTTSALGFAFGNPHPTPDDYNTLDPKDVFADANIKSTPSPEPVPPPWRTPPVLAASDVLGADVLSQIQQSGRIVFHAVGDTGGIKQPSDQFAVADTMSADLAGATYAAGRPAFFFHLGDVVYYYGQERYYYDQFYDPYRDYDAPIFAVPGNHDGVLFPGEPVKYSLEPFCNNFCTATSMHHVVAQGCARTTMTQPGVYFTLDAPFVKIIGLYSNTSEGATQGLISGPKVGPAQLAFLQSQLQTAAAQRAKNDRRALVIAVHHPPFTGSGSHTPNPAMLADIDAACQKAGIYPDVVLSGHAHLYERYTRTVAGRQIPYVVGGNGGYFNLSGFKPGAGGKQPKPPVKGTDAAGNPLTLESFADKLYGYLRLTVTPGTLSCEFVSVDKTTGKKTVPDAFSLNLAAHQVTSRPRAP